MTKNVNSDTNCVTYETSKLQLSDIKEVLELAKNCFSEPWNHDLFVSEINSQESICLKTMHKSKIIAYLIARYFVDELHIMQVATLPEFQRKGIASKLVSFLINNYKAERYLLEVRVSNISAINLYKSFGFDTLGIRKNYYSNGEDAIVMSRGSDNAR